MDLRRIISPYSIKVDSDTPRLTQGARSRVTVLNQQWKELKKEGETFQKDKIPAFNAACFQYGMGVLSSSQP